jgi:RNA polymerase sigma-70 factor (ECF subfamily)
VFARCRRILGNAQAAEDAVQETFLRVNRHLERVPDAADALRWIYRVAVNYCLNEIRNAQLRRRLGAEWGKLKLAAGHAADLLEGPVVRELVLRIPQKLSRVAWMYHVDGRDQHEIAEALGISRRTVVSRISQFARYARALLEGASGWTPPEEDPVARRRRAPRSARIQLGRGAGGVTAGSR